MTQGTLEERAQALIDILPTAISKARQHAPIVRGRQSAVQAALESRRDDLLSLLAAGHSANRLARLIHDEGARFSEEAIRIALKRMAGAAKSAVDSTRSSGNAAPTRTARRPHKSPQGMPSARTGSVQFDAVARQNDDL